MSQNEITKLTNKLNWAKKQTAYAWAQYYNQVRLSLHDDHKTVERYEVIIKDELIPTHIKNEIKEMAKELKKKWECPICMDMIEEADLEITNCGHYFCKGCLKTHLEDSKKKKLEKWICPMCKKQHIYKDD